MILFTSMSYSWLDAMEFHCAQRVSISCPSSSEIVLTIEMCHFEDTAPLCDMIYKLSDEFSGAIQPYLLLLGLEQYFQLFFHQLWSIY